MNKNISFSSNEILFSKDKNTLIKYSVNSGNSICTIPTSVTSIGDYAFSGCSKLTSITIPTSVTSIGDSAFSGCSNLQQIIVDENNPKFVSDDGILFSKDMQRLICYPSQHNQIVFKIPASVTSIENYAFYKCSKLKLITIPTSVTSIENSAFSCCSNLNQIIVDENNPKFVSDDGILFSKDMQRLICYPSQHSQTLFKIPASVTSIDNSAFSGCSNLKQIIVDENNTKFVIHPIITKLNSIFQQALYQLRILLFLNVGI